MLKQRILTALVLIPLIALTLLYAPFAVFALASTVVFSIAAWEWASLANCNRIVKICYVLVCSLGVGALAGICNKLDCRYKEEYNILKILDVITICWWFIIAIAVVTYPKVKNILTSKVLLLVAGLFTLVPAWHGLLVCFNDASGRIIVTLLLSISIIADTGAYFSGKYFGKTPLAPQVSPKKTIEGLAGAIILSVVIACAIYMIIGIEYSKKPLVIYEISYMLLMVFCLVIVAALGDLWESLVKRVHNVKDSGSILPGHGGILDRIDSHIAVFALFPVCYRIIIFF
jgi:phosphatidate cytidylyltransferase